MVIKRTSRRVTCCRTQTVHVMSVNGRVLVADLVQMSAVVNQAVFVSIHFSVLINGCGLLKSN